MTKFVTAFVGLVLVACVAAISAVFLVADPEPHPPHAHPGSRPGTIGPLSLAAVGADVPDVAGITAWFAGVERAEAERQVAVENVARSYPVRRDGGSVGSGACAALSAELGLPEAVLWRESRCSWDAYNATGCGGRGCLGPAQVDAGHFAPVSPWNSGTSGACAGLDPNDAAQYAECVSRLPSSAWG